MSDEFLIATVVQTARSIFKQANLEYSPTRVFREIRSFDSVLAVQFILAIEEALNVTLNEDEVDSMDTMGDLVDVLRSKTATT